MLDRVYLIEWLKDITEEEKEYANRIMSQMHADLKYPTEQDRHFTSDVIMNNIVFFKRIETKIHTQEQIQNK
jgi:hypothetical protein